MLNFARKLPVLVLLLLIPLQAVATSLQSILQCPPAVAAAVDSPVSGGGTAHERSGDGDKVFHEHSFCHQPFPGIPVTPTPAAMPDSPAFEFSVFPLSSLFSPEQPQRPPFSVSA